MTRTEKLFADAVEKNPRWAGLPLVRLGNSSIVMPDPSTWVPAHCSVCDRPMGAIGVPGKAMLVCPGDERNGTQVCTRCARQSSEAA